MKARQSSVTGSTYTPVPVIGLNGPAVNISAGAGFACALLTSGQVQCWGDNRLGQLGNNTSLGSSTNTPLLVQNLTGAVSITGGFNHACALLYDGTAKCWGINLFGQLGNNTNSGTGIANPSPLTVQSLSDIIQISAQDQSTCALLADGSMYCWGSNFHGTLGSLTNSGTFNPNPVPLVVSDIGTTGLRIFNNSPGADTTCSIVNE